MAEIINNYFNFFSFFSSPPPARGEFDLQKRGEFDLQKGARAKSAKPATARNALYFFNEIQFRLLKGEYPELSPFRQPPPFKGISYSTFSKFRTRRTVPER